MLYATTRSKADTYTAHRAMNEDRSSDGGFYVPFKMPHYDQTQIEAIIKSGFSESVAYILNQFFSCRLTGWDVDCCIGKSTAKLLPMSRRVILAALWNNSGGDYAYIEKMLYEKLSGTITKEKLPSWAQISIRIAVLFGIYSLLKESGIDKCDISVPAGDFSTPMAIWYAREMGLPLGMIICACNENSATWDFIHRGEMNTAASKVTTGMEDLDVVNPEAIERLVHAVFGFDETKKYIDKCAQKGIYQVRPDMLSDLNAGLFVSVVGSNRTDSLLSSVYRANGCVLDPYAAISYGGLQDYRAKTGESSTTLILWEKNPLKYPVLIQKATGLSIEEIQKILSAV